MVWPVKTHPAHSTGMESKKDPGDGEHFSLDFLLLSFKIYPFSKSRFVGCSRGGLPVRHPPQSGWLDELDRLKGGRSSG